MAVNVEELTFEHTDRVRGYLSSLIEMGGSDLHLKAEGKIKARVRGDIITLSDEVFRKREMVTLAKEMLRGRFSELVADKQADFTFFLNEDYRFRGNLFFQKDGVSAVFRVIPTKILSFADLELPGAMNRLADAHRGIVLVTGATGSGKSTTLASIINEINERHSRHIITIEDPIEFIHQDKNSIINQRSIGEDALDFASALKGALREDPDVILIGEMRDLASMEIALHAAETGHLVLGTLHTTDATETLNRVIGMFPVNEQNRIRLTLASVLQGVVSQRLVKTTDGGRRAALEILLKTERITDLIRKGRDDEIKMALEDGKEIYGTQTFDQSLYDLHKAGVLDEDEALANATSPDNLKLKIKGIGSVNAQSDVHSVQEATIGLKIR
jgi:twitching motility protein PilT